MDKGLVRCGSADIYYELHGSKGDYLVLLHGNGESMKRLHHQIDFFKEHFRVIAIDSRGHGESGFGQGSLNLSTMALDVETLLEQLGVTSTHVLGFSDGANIAMLLAAKRPELVKGLVLIGGNMRPTGMTLTSFLAVEAAYYLTKVAGAFDKRLRLEHEFFYLMAKEPNITPAMLGRITAKTLVVAGDKDMIKQSHTREIAGAIKNATLSILPGDHFIIYRTPQVINDLAYDFLKGI